MFGSGEGSTGDKTREKCAEMVYDALASTSDARASSLFPCSKMLTLTLGWSTATDLILSRARALEKHVHEQNLPPEGMSVYRTKMRSLFLNLKAQNNPSLREDVVSGEISVQRLYSMSPAVRPIPSYLRECAY